MMRSKQISVLGALLSLTFVLPACGGDEKSSQDGTTTSTTPQAAFSVVSPPVGAPAFSQSPDEILDYWTPEREANAEPFSVTASAQTSVPSGFAQQPSGASGVEGAPPAAGIEGAQPGRVAGDLDWGIVQKPYTQLPFRSVGVLYFNVGSARDASCSATSVGAPNESVVWTAAHCVYWNGKWSTKHKFVPGHYSAPGSSRKEKPYGDWPVRSNHIYVPQGWFDSAKGKNSRVAWHLDVAAIVVSRRNGATLLDTVGAQGLQWDHAPRRIVDLGYPADPSPPFAFGPMWICESAVVAGRTASDPLAIDCDFGEGASGGPWIEDYQAARGWGFVSSVNSFGIPTKAPDWYFGPRLGKAAANVYNAAKNK